MTWQHMYRGMWQNAVMCYASRLLSACKGCHLVAHPTSPHHILPHYIPHLLQNPSSPPQNFSSLPPNPTSSPPCTASPPSADPSSSPAPLPSSSWTPIHPSSPHHLSSTTTFLNILSFIPNIWPLTFISSPFAIFKCLASPLTIPFIVQCISTHSPLHWGGGGIHSHFPSQFSQLWSIKQVSDG